jgi:hypothetical protein
MMAPDPGAAPSEPPGGAAPPPPASSSTPARLLTRLRPIVARVPAIVWALLVYLAYSAFVFRDGFTGGGAPNLPVGTNALNFWLLDWWQVHHGDGVWLFPFTDWGQPLQGYTGPTLITVLATHVSPNALTRGLEFAGWTGAGLSMYVLVRWLRGSWLGALLAGFYYTSVAQVGQLFEGHVPLLITFAFAPVFLATVALLVRTPRFRWALAGAIELYLMATVGDLGGLYFVLFFVLIMAAYLLLRRLIVRRYSWRELARLAVGALAFVVLMLPWIGPYALGDRPQYTTSITVTTVTFPSVAGQNLVYSWLGFIQDNSYIHFAYHQSLFSYQGSHTLLLYAVVPALALLFVFIGWSYDRLLFYLSGILAVAFSGGNLYPWLSPFNRWVWTHVPFFNAIPAVLRWTYWMVLVDAVLLGLAITTIETGVGYRRPHPRRWISRHLRGRSPLMAPAWSAPPTRRWRLPRAEALPKRPLLALALVGVVVATVDQTWLIDARPPGFFQFPAGYWAGFEYIAGHPVQGEVLTIPYGVIYERSPWGGLSESAAYMAPYLTGADTDIFEAGTPSSLAIDNLLEGALSGGASRNVVKLLPGLNVQYVVATNYTNWSYASTVEGNPRTGYSALANQSGLAPALYVGGDQSVYPVPGFYGNLSFSPKYAVYFGGSATVDAILDAPWYPENGLPLIDGSTLGSGASDYIEHAAIVIVTPYEIAPERALLALAHSAGVPVDVVATAQDLPASDGALEPDPWNASAGLSWNFAGPVGAIGLTDRLGNLSEAGYGSAQVSGELACGPYGDVTVPGAGPNSTIVVGPPASSQTSLPITAAGYARASETNLAPGYPGAVGAVTVNGSAALNWTFLPFSPNYQYVALADHSLAGAAGLSVRFAGNVEQPPVVRLVHNGSAILTLNGYQSLLPISGRPSPWFFALPGGASPAVTGTRSALADLDAVELGFTGGSPLDAVTIENVSVVDAPSVPMRSIGLGTFPLAPNASYNISVQAPCRVGELAAIAGASGPLDLTDSLTSFRGTMADPADVHVTSNASGWGVYLLAQTYEPLWEIDAGGAPAYHAKANVGLNAWLVDAAPGASVHVWFQGQVWVDQWDDIGTAASAAGALVVAVAIFVRFRARRRTRSNPPEARS